MSKTIPSPYAVLNTPKRNSGLQRVGLIPYGGPLCGYCILRILSWCHYIVVFLKIGVVHLLLLEGHISYIFINGGFSKISYCVFHNTYISYIFHISIFLGWYSACFSTKQHSAPRLAGGPASGHEAQHSPGTSGSIL